MILSKRERTIVGLTTAVLVLLLADQFALTPLLSRRDRIEQDLAAVVRDLDKGEALLRQKRKLMPRWREMTESGLGASASDAESRLLRAIRDWAQESELTLSSVKYERTETERQFQKITWRAAGTGTMASVSRFLYRAQEASLPVRISDVQVSARQEGTDSLAIQVGIATLSSPAASEKERAASEPPRTASREEKR